MIEWAKIVLSKSACLVEPLLRVVEVNAFTEVSHNLDVDFSSQSHDVAVRMQFTAVQSVTTLLRDVDL